MVSPISGRLYEVINNKRIAGKWVEIESTSPVIYTKELNELVEVAMMPYEF